MLRGNVPVKLEEKDMGGWGGSLYELAGIVRHVEDRLGCCTEGSRLPEPSAWTARWR